MKLSEIFEMTTFQNWYNKKFGSNIILVDEIEKIRTEISNMLMKEYKIEGRETNDWSELASYLGLISSNLKLTEDNIEINYYPNINVRNVSEFSRLFIKPVNSIANKMWRKNKEIDDDSKFIKLDTLKNEIKDLVRFSMRSNSLANAETIAKAIQNSQKLKDEEPYKKFWDELISEIWTDTELKTESGYFAYHCYFKLKNKTIIELQVYSLLSDSWRILSHKIYEKVRDKDKIEYNFNDMKSRIVSIGHLLYLADCELHNLEEEFKKI